MNKREDSSPVSLSTMLGNGESFKAKGKSYKVKPITLQHIEEFMADNLSIGSQLFNVTNKDSKAKVNKWLEGVKDDDGKIIRPGYCFDEQGKPMSLEKAMADGWDVVDLKNFFKILCDLSG